ncbi:MAG TPA: hypothetical protein PKY82_24155 [Pyrinomonadaceae bacterium]|nr:hypothetical protein [Pyrinomonadaceae bacterium]
MKLIFTFCIFAFALCSTTTAQTNKPALPGNLVKYINEYPVKLMKVPAIKTRLKTLLGKNYSTFESYITVQSPMTRVGDFLFASGCLPHSCTINEAAFAIDLKNKRIHAVIYEQNITPKFFNEDKTETPKVLLDWIKELKAM